MAEQIQLEVITPERRVVSERVDAVTVPALGGEIGVLPGHAPLISQIQTGILSYTQGGATHRLHVSGGFVEVSDDQVTVLADVAELPEEIDAARARRAREQAEKILSSFSGDQEEFARAMAKLERSLVRIQLAEEFEAIRR
ncbi:F0F1 ATP synthase subunit epsilon [Pyrinomonas methylaliphatogenes]|jgi:F-type H+-transporting ATPase subunit epsilon|uniref:ATP synthase epsilon chain n=1 Tax=Pyrinomonas methylaliphatogenes TaxID=454194 RepID=A0A0B6X3N7_9BACT|nr:F0F1 ATP synthase subunit epsilon [Pyrinomonas methylaliphatogenes]MBX5478064.1 F0F1 ATP synthase subunit epsilon [Pyrinomonas methylaliphatogenes]CDM66915.1 ATP synthase, F1 epsilon subunit [Pyrinomonas methylaliphatogenes]